MFEKYKKGIGKYDLQFKMDLFFKIVFLVMIILATLIMYFFDWIYLIKLLVILTVEILIIIIGMFIIFIYNLNKIKTDEKSILNKTKTLFKLESIHQINFVVSLLKEYNINSCDKLLHMINFYKDKYQKLVLSESQSFFGLFVIFMGMGANFYNDTLRTFDEAKFGFSFGFTIIALMIYGTIKILKYIFYKILVSTKDSAYEKFMNSLNYVYLHFEEYKSELKNNVK